MNREDVPYSLYSIKVSKAETGLGIFALKNFKPNELIERCPILQLSIRRKYHIDKTLLNYVWLRGCPCQECKNHGDPISLLLGYGSLYNHRDINNATTKWHDSEGYCDIISLQHIKKGSEIFLNYGPGYFMSRKKTETYKELDAMGDKEFIETMKNRIELENKINGCVLPKE